MAAIKSCSEKGKSSSSLEKTHRRAHSLEYAGHITRVAGGLRRLLQGNTRATLRMCPNLSPRAHTDRAGVTHCRVAAGTRPGFAWGRALTTVSPTGSQMLHGQLGRQRDLALPREVVTLMGHQASLRMGTEIWKAVLTAGRAATGTILRSLRVQGIQLMTSCEVSRN